MKRYVVLLVLTACGPPLSRDITPESDTVSFSERAAKVVSIDTTPKLVNVNKTGIEIRYVGDQCGTYFPPTIFATEKIFVGDCGVADSPRVNIHDLHTIVLVHELGHAFGLKHSEDPKSIMFINYQYDWTVDGAADSLQRELAVGKYSSTIPLPPNAPLMSPLSSDVIKICSED